MFSLFGPNKIISYQIFFNNNNEISIQIKPEINDVDFFEYLRFWSLYSLKVLWNFGPSEDENSTISNYLEKIYKIANNDFKNNMDCFDAAEIGNLFSYIDHCKSVTCKYEGFFYKKGNNRFIYTKFPLDTSEEQIFVSLIAFLQYIIDLSPDKYNIKLIKNTTHLLYTTCVGKNIGNTSMYDINKLADLICFSSKEILQSGNNLFWKFASDLDDYAGLYANTLSRFISQDNKKENEPDITYGQYISVYIQYIFLYLHLLQRMLYDENYANQEELISKLLNNSIENAKTKIQKESHKAFSKQESDIIIKKFTDDFCNESDKYSCFINTIPKSTENHTGTLFWEFGKDIARILDRKDDFIIIQTSQMFALESALKKINIPLFVYNLQN